MDRFFYGRVIRLARKTQGKDTWDVARRRKVIIVVFLLVGVAGGFWAWFPAKPSYQGRSASAWIEDYQGTEYVFEVDLQKSERARAALKAMGPKVAPVIIEKLKKSE